MANAGPNTNGSQFFIIKTATPWLNGNHRIFRQVIEDLGIVKNIARVEVNFSDKSIANNSKKYNCQTIKRPL